MTEPDFGKPTGGKPLEIQAELTPNPNTLKFVTHKRLLEKGSCNFPDRESAQKSLLAQRLFEIEGAAGVMVGVNFVTVTKTPSCEWPDLARDVVESLRYFLESGDPAVSPECIVEESVEGMSELERGIRDILDQEIRPAVARDGGDIVFYGYENGVVKLHLQGACSSCPSSIMTLKMGIENRLRQAFPEIKEVVQV